MKTIRRKPESEYLKVNIPNLFSLDFSSLKAHPATASYALNVNSSSNDIMYVLCMYPWTSSNKPKNQSQHSKLTN